MHRDLNSETATLAVADETLKLVALPATTVYSAQTGHPFQAKAAN